KIEQLIQNIGLYDTDKGTPDDLKVINGIGPKMEALLNSIGIYTYLQVSKMSKTEYDLLDAIIGSFPGRAERENWAGQAQKLLNI
ncbi:MAG: molybdopterin oxidoreductase, partial [Bacteroidota bacterium]